MQIGLEGIPEHLTPILITKKQLVPIEQSSREATSLDVTADEGYLDWLAGEERGASSTVCLYAENYACCRAQFHSNLGIRNTEWRKVQAESLDDWIALRDVANAGAVNVREFR